MAEVEFAGINFKGGKAVVLVTALSTLGGGRWAGFEFYADYMKTKTSNFKEDKDFIVDVFTEIVAPNEKLYEFFEDKKTTKKYIRCDPNNFLCLSNQSDHSTPLMAMDLFNDIAYQTSGKNKKRQKRTMYTFC